MKNLAITEIQIIPVKPHNGLLAFCSFVLNNQFYISDVAIFSRLDGGYRLVYPIKVLPNGVKVNCFHPISREPGEEIEKIVIGEYKKLISKTMNEDETIMEEKDSGRSESSIK